MVFTLDQLRTAILEALPGAHVEVGDLTGTSDHFEAVVVATQFEGRSRIEQHQMVYRSLGSAVGREIHALALQTFTPEAWARKGRGP
jgi:acid stress-induced BolA-like protein IbaG/YrbA